MLKLKPTGATKQQQKNPTKSSFSYLLCSKFLEKLYEHEFKLK